MSVWIQMADDYNNEEICQSCGTKNPANSEFCKKCGKSLKTGTSSSGGIKSWWDRRTSTEKTLAGIGVFFVGISSVCLVIFFLLFMGFTVSDVTALSIPTTHAQIDNKTTEYVIQGTSEPDACITVAVPDRKSSKNITADSKGKFEYKVQVPLDSPGVYVSVSASKPGKIENSATVTINRPKTPLKLEKKPFKTGETVTINGTTVPHAEVGLSAGELDIQDASVTVNPDGSFFYSLEFPENVTQARVTVTSKSRGMRVNSKTINITSSV